MNRKFFYKLKNFILEDSYIKQVVVDGSICILVRYDFVFYFSTFFIILL